MRIPLGCLRRKQTSTTAKAVVAVIALSIATLVAASCATGRVPQTFENDGFVFTYPDSWETIDPSEMRQYPGGELLFAASPSDDGTSVNWIRMTSEYTADVEEVAQQDWAVFEDSNSGVIVESQEITEVGGQPAVRRVFSVPYEDIPGGRAHIVQVYIVNDQRLYVLTGWAPSADALGQHLAEIQGILASVQFTR